MMTDTDGHEYVEIMEYPSDPYWCIGTLHLVQSPNEKDPRNGQLGEVVRHGRSPEAHHEFATRVMLSEDTGIPLESSDYEILIIEEGPVLRFPDGGEVWYPGMCTSVLFAVTGDDPTTLYRKHHPEENGND